MNISVNEKYVKHKVLFYFRNKIKDITKYYVVKEKTVMEIYTKLPDSMPSNPWYTRKKNSSFA